MGYIDDAKALVGHCKPTLDRIMAAYEVSLREKTIKSSLMIEIKNLMENLRSALDFTAHGLFDKYGDKTKAGGNIYFPYAWSGLDKAGFASKRVIEQKIPGLTANRPDIAAKIESYQHFAASQNGWLPKFMDLNNENKHQQLTPQTRKESKQLNISSGGVSISMGEGTSISMGPGTSIRMGDAIIPGGQHIDVNNPARVIGNAKQEVITWVSFNFSTNDEPVYPFLQQALTGVSVIVEELSAM
jgi:hypothetical protein